ncbi:MAG: NAD(+)/NADH kinase [Opitutales bacterium]|nr:NAD(+)/NADH kinase [Opitutales bacterium]
MNSSKNKILFAVNYGKANAPQLAQRLARAAREAGFDCAIDGEFPPDEEAFRGAKCCCAIGGDGTILSCLKGAVKYDVPIFGINLGKLGFMATFTDAITDAEFAGIIKSENSEIETRAILCAQFGGKSFLALNEFAVKSSASAGMLSAEVFANGEFVAEFAGDGLIFATPTGTSAYNLSAGGPLIHPKARVFALTSICPHTLSSRSLVFDAETALEIRVKNPNSVLIQDGNIISSWHQEPLKIEVSNKSVKFVRQPGHSHFYILRTKLGWGGNPRNSNR